MPHVFRNPLRSFVLLIGTLGLISPPISHAQVNETFEDGDFLFDPTWIGDTDRWTIGELNESALQSNGIAAADTIYLATASETAYGLWQFTVAHRRVNLSSFNGTRIFLTSDRADPRESAVGYYLQLGTNNSDVVSLWRSDGSLASRRVELGRSSHALVAGDSSLLRLRVERDGFGRFRVYTNDALVISAMDNRHRSSAFFAIWVKHSTQGATSFLYDDILVEDDRHEVEGPVPRRGEIVINEVLFDPEPGLSEFIELYNGADTPFDLRHLRIRDARSDDSPISFVSRLIEPGGFVVLAEDSSSFYSGVDGGSIIQVDGWPPLNNGGDTVILSGSETVVDSLSYSGAGSMRGVSLERIDPHAPSESYNFGPSLDSSGSTPGRVNSIFEVDETAPSILFVEQTDAATLEVHFNEPVRIDEITPASIEYDVDVLELIPLSMTALKLVLGGSPVNPVVRIENVRDRKGNRSDHLTHPISFVPRTGDLALSEIMYEPLADAYDGRPDQVEFVELINTSPRPISVSGLIRTRDVDESGDADTLRFGRPFSTVMPGSYVLVTAADSAALWEGFPTTPIDAQTIYIHARGLTLANGGDRVRIHNRLGVPIEEVAYEPQWHHPDLAARRGFSLERVDMGAPVNDAANWSSSAAPDGGTPGAANSISFVPRLIDEAYGIDLDPSPFSPDGDGHEDATVISYRLQAHAANVRIRIYDVDGFEVRTLEPAGISSSSGRVVWDGRDGAGRPLRVGIYIIVLEAVDAETRRVEQYKRPAVLARRFR